MSSCPECRKILLGNKEKCSCGWKAPRQARQSTGVCEHPGCPDTGTLSRHTGEGGWQCSRHHFGEVKQRGWKSLILIASRKKRAEVDDFIRKNPKPTKRESCFLYLRENGLFGLIPKAILEDDTEAKQEREAIQNEALET